MRQSTEAVHNPVLDSPSGAIQQRGCATPMKVPNANDRRVRRTRRQLREALLTLVAQRGWNEVSVLDVCAQADVGRSTFYTHFADKEALLLSGYDDLRQQLRAVTAGADRRDRLAFLAALIAHVEASRSMFRAIVGKRAGQLAVSGFRNFVFELLRGELDGLVKDPTQRQIMARYAGGGISEVLIWYVDARPAPAAKTVEAMCRALTELIISNRL